MPHKRPPADPYRKGHAKLLLANVPPESPQYTLAFSLAEMLECYWEEAIDFMPPPVLVSNAYAALKGAAK